MRMGAASGNCIVAELLTIMDDSHTKKDTVLCSGVCRVQISVRNRGCIMWCFTNVGRVV